MRKVLLFCAIALSAQTPAFEVASVKLGQSPGGVSSIRVSNGMVTMENVSLKKLILIAYGIPDDREYALAGPNWLTARSFDIQAKFPANTPMAQVRQMTQALLAERFKLVLHRETRQLPGYALVVAKDGPKIRPVEDGQGRTSGGPGRLEASKITMQKLADLLARLTGYQVVEATGLMGAFDFTLEWTPDDAQQMVSPDDGAAVAASGSSIFSALQDQLGLKLESRKGPVEILVVDHVERAPTEN